MEALSPTRLTPIWRFQRCARTLGAIMALLSAGVLPAIDQAPLRQLSHSSWSGRNGFEIFPIRALAQTPDGYLWIGTPKGLWRFDGARFVPWQPRNGEHALPSQDIRYLAVARDGGLWVVTAAGLAKLVSGRLTSYAPPPGWPTGSTRALAEPDGLWIGSGTPGQNSLARLLPSGEWVYNPLSPLSDTSVNAIFEDQNGSLWIGTNKGLCRWSSGKAAFFLTDPPTEIYSITQSRDGQLFVASSGPAGVLRFSEGKFVPAVIGGAVKGRVVTCDRSNAVWVGTFSQGLGRIQDGHIEWYGTSDGLSSPAVEAVLEDVEGNVWVGTRGGLDRFRPARVTSLTPSQGLPEDVITAISASRQGEVWAGTATMGLRRLEWKNGVLRVGNAVAGNSILSIYEEASHNKLWLGSMNGLFTYQQGSLETVDGEAGESLDRVTAITGDGRETVWISDARKGIYSIRDGIARAVRLPSLPDGKNVYALMAGNDGRLWIAYYHGDVAAVSGAGVTLYRAADRGFSGAILSLYQDTRGNIWAGTSRGLSRLRNGRWTEWTSAEGLHSGTVHGVIADDWNGLWLNAERGLLRIPATELDAQPDGLPSPLHSLIYGASEGVSPQGGTTRTQPRIARAADGRIWFAREDGITIVDPQTAIPDVGPPRVIVEELRVDGRPATSLSGRQTLAFRGRQLDLEFTATSLSAAENVRFRCQLTGYDPGWIDLGTDRHTRYTNLPPGQYRFTVNASNTEGLWPDATSAIGFTVLPYFHQTWYFRTICGVAGFAVLFAAYRRRLTQMRRSYDLRADERLAERTRIARELHDTLLQSVVGVSLQLDALANRGGISADTIQADLRRIRRQVDDSLREARHCVWALRSPILTGKDFVASLQEIVAGLISGRQIHFSVIVEGKLYRHLHDTEEHLLRITHQAVTNSVLHSGCAAVRICANYGDREFFLQIVDDGAGLEPDVLSAGRPGHFGISNMRERAKQIGATFRVDSGLGRGTTIEVRLPTPTHQRSKRMLAAIRLI